MQYLQEGRRGTWCCYGKVKVRAIEAGAVETRPAGFEKENPRTNPTPAQLALGERLAYRTQQRIVRAAAWGYGRLEDGCAVAGACGRALHRERCRGCDRFYRPPPGVGHSKSKMGEESEQ